MRILALVLPSIIFLFSCSPKNTPEQNNAGAVETENTSKAASIDGCIDKSKIDKDGICTMQYDPVCGCDGKTYGNACMAEKSGVTFFTAGECDGCIDASLMKPKAPCPRNYDPVCGCNGIEYANLCLAKNAGLKKWKPGKCQGTADCLDIRLAESMANQDCPENYDPVCGCDGKTYGNECEAKKAGATRFTPGKCAGQRKR